jgi:hypothetical protein
MCTRHWGSRPSPTGDIYRHSMRGRAGRGSGVAEAFLRATIDPVEAIDRTINCLEPVRREAAAAVGALVELRNRYGITEGLIDPEEIVDPEAEWAGQMHEAHIASADYERGLHEEGMHERTEGTGETRDALRSKANYLLNRLWEGQVWLTVSGEDLTVDFGQILADALLMYQAANEPCPSCGGSGVSGIRDCPYCEGYGTRTKEPEREGGDAHA